jgi:hypothetical protein
MIAGPDGTAFARALMSHDWWFSYSDDARVWRAGSAARDALDKTRREMGECGDRIWALFAPTGF